MYGGAAPTCGHRFLAAACRSSAGTRQAGRGREKVLENSGRNVFRQSELLDAGLTPEYTFWFLFGGLGAAGLGA
jgi:hypothetical protein